jgi:hypothetical protein
MLSAVSYVSGNDSRAELNRTPMRQIEEAKKVDHRVWFYLPGEMHRKIKAAAAADDRSVANWLRRTVEAHLRSERTAA